MTLGIPDVYPSRALLIRFAGLADAPAEKIRAFAERFGALQEQISRRPSWQTEQLGPDFALLPVAWQAPPLLADRQPISYWRLISGSLARALRRAANPATLSGENDLTWLVNGHLWQAGVEDFLTFVNGQPRILHSAGGLYGGLAVELLSAVAQAGLRLCVGCGAPLEKGWTPVLRRVSRRRRTRAEPTDEVADAPI